MQALLPPACHVVLGRPPASSGRGQVGANHCVPLPQACGLRGRGPIESPLATSCRGRGRGDACFPPHRRGQAWAGPAAKGEAETISRVTPAGEGRLCNFRSVPANKTLAPGL